MENRVTENGMEQKRTEAARNRRKKNLVEISGMLLGLAAGAALGYMLHDILTWSVVGLGVGIVFGCAAANRNTVKQTQK